MEQARPAERKGQAPGNGRRDEAVVQAIQEHYAGIARRAARLDDGQPPTGCGCSTSGRGCCSGASAYSPEEHAELPGQALAASAGCGNPVALARLHPGEMVLDLGSGGGIDVLLAARRVGPGGFAWGIDLTDEMLALAEANRRRAGLDNVAFLKGRIEAVPLPASSVDVVISNCVINLSVDKAAALREAARVLRPGGRLAVYDVIALEPLPAAVRLDLKAWSRCEAGALDAATYERLLQEAGLTDVEILPVSAPQSTCCGGECRDDDDAGQGLPVASAFIRARKPGPVGFGRASLSVEPALRADLPAILHLLAA
ncbi:MAG: arsenite methyltransferase, partial [Firmicutes bacterium]|nr:arsenite methyltransferase [Bacillota bacterium]